MQEVTPALLASLKNPNGYYVINDPKFPTLTRIIDDRGRHVDGKSYTSRAEALHKLHMLLIKENTPKKEAKRGFDIDKGNKESK